MARITDTDALIGLLEKGKTEVPSEWGDGFNAGLEFAIARAGNNCVLVDETTDYKYGYISAASKALLAAAAFIENNDDYYKFARSILPERIKED